MAPQGHRADARKRASQAYNLRCMGRGWQEIADATGYKSAGAAFTAVKGHIERMPAEDQEISRAYSAGSYRLVIAQLHEIVAKAKAMNKPHTAVQALQAISEVQDKHDRLIGLTVAPSTKVEVTVTSAVAVLDRAEEQLLAIAGQQPQAAIAASLPVLDAEVVEP